MPDKSVTENVTKIFISLPITGIDQTDAKERREAIFKRFLSSSYANSKRGKGTRVRLIDNIAAANPKEHITGNERLYFLGGSIQKLKDADLVIFADGWGAANGCIVERWTCILYKIPFIEERELR